MKQKYWLLLLLFTYLCTLSVKGQVTIGSAIQSKSGALLDLKQYNDPTALAGGRNAEKGYCYQE